MVVLCPTWSDPATVSETDGESCLTMTVVVPTDPGVVDVGSAVNKAVSRSGEVDAANDV
jgi:hypothetical protein